MGGRLFKNKIVELNASDEQQEMLFQIFKKETGHFRIGTAVGKGQDET